MLFTPAEKESIIGLLFSNDEESINTAFEIIELVGNEGIKTFLTELYGIHVFYLTKYTVVDKSLDFLNLVINEVNGLQDALDAKYKLKEKATLAQFQQVLQLCPDLDGKKLLAGMFLAYGHKLKLWSSISDQERSDIIKYYILGTKLKIVNATLNKVPKAIFENTSLTELDLSNNRIKSIPKDIEQLTQLKMLDLSRNQLKKLPKSIGKLQQLEILKLSQNSIAELPKEFAQLTNLRELDLSWNLMLEFSNTIAALPNLEKLNIGQLSYSDIPKPIDSIFFNMTSKKLIQIKLADSDKMQKKWTNLPKINSLLGTKENPIDTSKYKV